MSGQSAKAMVRVCALLAFVLSYPGTSLAAPGKADDPLRVLLTVGGVDYHTSIVRLLKSNPAIELFVHDVDEDGAVITGAVLAGMDAVLLYHRDNIAEVEEREALLDFLAGGGGVVVLHHAIANYPHWEAWWQDHVGGLYALADSDRLPPSTYFADFKGVARPAGDHPITRRIGASWRYADESYDRLWVSSEVEVLLTTTAFGSAHRLAWIGPSPSGRVVFIQPGHGEPVLTDPRYLNLVEDALRWTARPAGQRR